MERELKRLVKHEGFCIHCGAWDEPVTFSRVNWPDPLKVRKLLGAGPPDRWVGFQLYYPMREEEVRASVGLDLVESMLAVFREVTPAMNLCMQTKLVEVR